MRQTEIQQSPENYYHMDVAGLAQFVINASDEVFADLRVREYCKQNDFLKIDLDSHFDIFNNIKKISDDETIQLRKYQFAQDMVRLIGWREAKIVYFEPVTTTNTDFESSQPQQLFD